MPFESNNNFSGRTFVADTVTFDQGLRRHMIGVYNHMMLGLIVTGILAYVTAHNQAMLQAIYTTPLRFVVMLAPFAFILVLGMGIRRLSLPAAQVIFYAFSATMGLSLASVFMVYQGQSISLVFFITAGMFAGMSLYGYTTGASLARMGSFMIMGLFGLIIASIANVFLHSTGLQFLVSLLAVVVFTGLTAWDTQRIKQNYSEGYGVESNGKLAIMGALSLYLDFINLFLAMLRLFGNRR